MTAIRCASCSHQLLRAFVSEATGLELPRPVWPRPFFVSRPRSNASSRLPFRRFHQTLASTSEAVSGSRNDGPHEPSSQDTAREESIRSNDDAFWQAIGDQQKTRPNDAPQVEASPPHDLPPQPEPPRSEADYSLILGNGLSKNKLRKLRRHGEQPVVESPSVTAAVSESMQASKISTRAARREASRQGLSIGEFLQLHPTHPTVLQERRKPKKQKQKLPAEEQPEQSLKTDSKLPKPYRPQRSESWQVQKDALKDKFDEAPWTPRKRLSPDALDGIRALHHHDPEQFSTETLAEHFKVSPENIRRILKSKWRPSGEEQEDRMLRWDKRGQRIWNAMVELGVRPPKKWRELGIGRPPPGERPSWKQKRQTNKLLAAEAAILREEAKQRKPEGQGPGPGQAASGDYWGDRIQ
jgi:hypothetical protein